MFNLEKYKNKHKKNIAIYIKRYVSKNNDNFANKVQNIPHRIFLSAFMLFTKIKSYKI